MRRRIFVGSSREAIGICRVVQDELNDEFDVTVWDQGVFQLSRSGFDSLLDVLDSSDAGIFVLRADDLTTRRDVQTPSARDNVIFELGMFVGRHIRQVRIVVFEGAAASLTQSAWRRSLPAS